MSEDDEIVLNVLLVEGIDAPTAYAAAQSEAEPVSSNPWLLIIVLAAGAFAMWWIITS